MALKDIQIPKVDVQVTPDSKFAVRALNLSDIEHLVREHGESMRQLFNDFVGGNSADLKLTDLMPVFKQVIGKAPALVVDLIALAADADAEDRAVLVRLGLTVQINALVQIATITLSTEGDLGKALETVIKVLGGLNGGLGEALRASAQ